MVKNIKKTTSEETWSKEFDKKFYRNYMEVLPKIGYGMKGWSSDDIKSFIRQVRQEAVREVLEEIEKEIKKLKMTMKDIGLHGIKFIGSGEKLDHMETMEVKAEEVYFVNRAIAEVDDILQVLKLTKLSK